MARQKKRSHKKDDDKNLCKIKIEKSPKGFPALENNPIMPHAKEVLEKLMYELENDKPFPIKKSKIDTLTLIDYYMDEDEEEA